MPCFTNEYQKPLAIRLEIPSKIYEIRRITVFPEDNLQMIDLIYGSQSFEDYLQEKQLSSEFHRFSTEFQVLLSNMYNSPLSWNFILVFLFFLLLFWYFILVFLFWMLFHSNEPKGVTPTYITSKEF